MKKILFRKDFAFGQTIVGVILLFIPVVTFLTISKGQMSFYQARAFFTLVSLACGGIGIFLIMNGYYKLLNKFKEYEPAELAEIRKKKASEKSSEESE